MRQCMLSAKTPHDATGVMSNCTSSPVLSVPTHLIKLRPSAVRPEMTSPMWSSTRKHFCWCDASSEGERLSAAITTCVADATPTHTAPCFTASIAYSTWNRRPWGLQDVTSVSYYKWWEGRKSDAGKRFDGQRRTA